MADITYSRVTSQYRDNKTGKFVSRAKILSLVDEEANRLAVRLKAHVRLLTENKISLSEMQQRAAEDLKLSHLRSALLASGGRSLATSQTYGSVGRLLRSQYEYLDNFSRDLAAGKLTVTQAIARASLYGASTRAAFHQSEKIAKGREGFKLARRVLDVNSKHCFECIQFATGDRFVPIETIVPVGTRCTCQSRCRCSIIWRKN